MRSLILALSASFLLFASGCDKNNDGPAPEDPTVILINSPAASGLFFNGTLLKVEGSMDDDNGISQARVEIRNKTTGNILFQNSTQANNVGFYLYSWSWTVSGITGPVTATVKVIARDSLGNEIFKEVDITLDV